MKEIHCPYLGMEDDPGTALDFPSMGNFCHKAAPPDIVKLDYQQRTCLTEGHTGCPVYLAAQARPLPEAIRVPAQKSAINRRTLALIAIPLVLFLLVGVGLAFGPAMDWLGSSALFASRGNTNQQQPSGFSLFTIPRTGPTAQTPSPATPGTPTATLCPIPEGWVTYTVYPTDSLYRLSVLHGVTVDTLQQANCMGSETVLTPGQVIYLPFVPTATPTFTRTPTIFLPTWTFTPEPPAQAPPPADPPTSEPPTDPPTDPPPTEVPPTVEPPTEEPPTDEPPPVKTKKPKPTKKSPPGNSGG